MIDYSSGFSSTTGLTLSGAANQSGSDLNLTTGTGTESYGNFFYNTLIDVNSSFSVDFTFNASVPFGGDGITFIMQNQSTNNFFGTQGANSQGYRAGAYDEFSLGAGISSSVVVMYHTFNGSNVTLTTAANSFVTMPGDSGTQLSGAGHTGHIDYNAGTDTLTAYLDGSLALTQTVDISSFTGSSAYMGFGGRTGAGGPFQPFAINNWTVSTVPEPSTVWMLGLGLGLMGFVSIRRILRPSL